MRVCFVLSTDGSDCFPDATLIAASCVRRLHPSAEIALALDEQSSRCLHDKRHPVTDVVDEVRTCQAPKHPDLVCRNRFVKSRLRLSFDGPFLYLDADALVIRPIDRLFENEADFSATPNRHRGRPVSHFPSEVAPAYQSLGWTYPTRDYFNGGVLYFADNERTRRFAEDYHRRWLEHGSIIGSYRDQAALNAALNESDLRIERLAIEYNATIDAAPCFARKARIWHFFTRDGAPRPESLLGHLVTQFHATGDIDWATFDCAVATDNPWIGGEHRYWGEKGNGFVDEQYLQWTDDALDADDIEAAAYFLRERVVRKPVSRRTWGRICRFAWRRIHTLQKGIG